MTKYRKLSGSELTRGARIRFMRWVLIRGTALRQKKSAAPAWGPAKARSIFSVVFTPTRGVIHPSFPLRGRWERFAKNGEQAPSPSLAAFYISSCKTRLHPWYCNKAANAPFAALKVKTILMCALRLAWRMALCSKTEAATISELSKTESGIASLRLADAYTCP
jgi:hypothetical protein